VFDIEVERTHNFIANGLCASNTRWHEDDLPGRILNSDGGGDWTVLSLPALAEEDDPLGRDVGEALWPDTVATAEEWDAQQRSGVHRGIRPDPFLAGAYRKPKYPLAWLEAVKRTLPARSWAALYQQRPVPMEGAVIRGEWIQHWTALPPDRVDAEGKPYVTSWQVIQTVDSAWDEGVEHDPSAIATWATDGADYYLLDYWSGNVDFPDLQAEVVRRFLSQRWRPTYIFVEDAANGRPLIQQLARTRYQAADGTSVSLPVAPFRPEGAKIARLEAVTPLFSTHNVYVPTAAPWLADFLAELVGFPYMTHDESADTTSSALLKLAPWLSQRVGLQIQMGPQGLPETPARRRIREYEERQQRARRGPQWPRGGVQVPGVSGPVRPRG
jgi:predicted phage terminase large subunit-like protein